MTMHGWRFQTKRFWLFGNLSDGFYPPQYFNDKNCHRTKKNACQVTVSFLYLTFTFQTILINLNKKRYE
jgi:hypothetical protein